MALFSVQRPYEYVIEYFGEFNDIFKPGLRITIPGVTSIRSRVKVNTTQLLELYREESKPILVKSGIKTKPKVTVRINIHEPYAVTYKLDVHDNFVVERQKIGVKYRKDERYFYAIEETLDSLIRSFFGSLDIEAIIELREGKVVVNDDTVKEIERMADKKLKKYGVDIEEILITEIEVLDEDVLEILRKKFKAIQNEQITQLQEKVEIAQVKVETQKALQREKQGKGEGSFFQKQMDALREQGLTPSQAAEFIVTQKWADAAQKGANIKIISTGSDGRMSMPLMTGIGMGIGQETSQEKPKEATKEETQETSQEKKGKGKESIKKTDQTQEKKGKKQTK